MGAQEDLIAQIMGQSTTGADVTDLGNFQKAIGANDYWKQAAVPIGAAKFDTSTWKPSTTAGVLAAQGFLGSILNGLGQRNEADQMNKVASVLPALYSDPISVSAPEGVDPGAFGALKASAIARNSKGQSAALSDLMNKVLGVRLAGQTAAEEAKGKILGANAAYGIGNIQNPDSPIAKEEDAARNEILTAAKYPAVAKLQTTSTALSQLKDIKDLNTASSDIPFATLFIGGLDGSVVREGEYARVAGANPFLEKFRNQLEGALNGTSTLGVDIKRQMFGELQKTQQGLLGEAIIQTAPRIATAKARGADPAKIYPFDPNMSFTTDHVAGDITKQTPGSADLTTTLTAIRDEMKNPATTFERKQQLRDYANSLAPKPTTYNSVPIG